MTELTEQQKKNIAESKAKTKRTKIKVFWQDAEKDDDKVFAGRTWRVHLDPKDLSRYEDGEVQITVHKDGAVSFWEEKGEQHIYFYPDQVRFIRSALKFTSARKFSRK